MNGTAPARPARPAREFLRGVRLLVRGFGFWLRRPGLMALGLLPAILVALVFTAAVVVVALNAPVIGGWLTPFAEGWEPLWRDLIRLAVGVALALALLAVGSVAFTGLALAVGDPVYAHIWRAVERERGPGQQFVEPRFWRSLGDSVLLVLRTLGGGLLLALIGLIPAVGAGLSFVLGVFLSGRLVATELTARPLEARGMLRRDRIALLRRRNALVAGFGAAVHLCFLIPFGAVLAMPAAVAGATMLAHELLGTAAPASRGATADT